MKRIRKTDEWKKIYREYKTGKSVRVLSKELGTHVQTLYSAFTRRGWKLDVPYANDKVKETYFKSFETAVEAYAFGLWLTDGHLHGRSWVITQQVQDKTVLEAISNDFYRRKAPALKHEQGALRFSGNSVIVAKRLAKMFRVQKTESLWFPISVVPVKFHGAFLRGIIDGDGSVYYEKRSPDRLRVTLCSISLKFLKQIQNWLLNEHAIKSTLSTELRSGKRLRIPGGWTICSHDMHRLHIGTHESRVKLYELMHLSDNGPRIQRKYENFTRYYGNAVQLLASKAPALPSDPAPYHEQHLNGRSIRDIGRELGHCCNTVSRWFKKHGLEVRSRVTRRS